MVKLYLIFPKLKMMDGREDVAYFKDNVQFVTIESVPEVSNHSYLMS